MFGLAALLSLIAQVSGTPYIPGGDTPSGTDCSGLASWVANVASGRPAFGSRFNTGNIESSLLSRGFHYGSAPNSVVIGWNGGHAAVTLPDGTPVSSGESGRGVRVGGGGAYQSQFSRHMYLPIQAEEMHTTVAPTVPTDLTDLTDLTDPTEASEATATQEGPVIITVADGTVADGTVADGTVIDVAATNTVVEPTVESAVGRTVAPLAGDVPALAGT